MLKRKILSYILVAAIALSLLPANMALASTGSSVSISLGSATLSAGTYYYHGAAVAGSNLRTILVSFSDSVASGDKITLPSSPSGFTVSTSSSTNDYAKRINLAAGTSTSSVQDYIRAIGFTVASATQSLSITVTTDNVQADTYYNSTTQHYYQYIPDTSSYWTTAYIWAKSDTYMGRKGYLATITSKDEDTFVNSLSGGKTGWLGGTIYTNTGTASDALYYSGFNNNAVVSTGWYWACGPEKGTTFYNVNSLYPNANVTNATTVDSSNSTYFNWGRGPTSYEPNNKTATVTNTDNDYETCLTTLVTTNTGKQGTTFSWNDVRNVSVGSGDWDARGYFVEYGDSLTGDSGSGNTAFATARDTIEGPSIHLTTVAWQNATTYTCGVDLPDTARMVTLSVDSGTFTVPSLGGALTFLGGTNGTSYIKTYESSTQLTSVVFSFSDVSAAETALGGILYSPAGVAPQTISATSSTVSPQSGDIFFEGHFYRYIAENMNWPSAVLAAGGTTDPYFGGRGYIATATSQAENSILLRLTDTGENSSDHWNDAWMGGLWQRNQGTLASPNIAYGTDGNEITYSDIKNVSDVSTLLKDYTIMVPGFSGTDPSTFIMNKSSAIRYYWIDGPEAGEEIENNTVDFAPWHVTDGTQDEPNSGDFIYIGWQGAYWDDLSAYDNDNTNGGYTTKDGYIVEFSGYDGGSTAGIVTDAQKTTSDYPATVYAYLNGSLGNVSGAVELYKDGSKVATCARRSVGTYIAAIHDGVFDVYISGVDTGKNLTISGNPGSVRVDYYMVSYAVTDDSTAYGSTIAATADGTAISGKAVVQAGRKVVITATGAGATSYTYAWRGEGTSGETTDTVTIDALSGRVNAECLVTGTTAYGATVYTYIDGIFGNISGAVELRQGGSTVATCSNITVGTYTTNVQEGVYDVYIDNVNTGKTITVGGDSGSGSANVDFYTISASVTDAGTAYGSTIGATANGTAINSGWAVVMEGSDVVITATGVGATSYTYEWTGTGANGETADTLTIASLSGTVNVNCTVTGTSTFQATVYTTLDSVAADVTGSVELWQSGSRIATLTNNRTGEYVDSVSSGLYDVFIGGVDAGENLVIDGGANSTTVNYYTVHFAVANIGVASGSTISATAGGADISSGAVLLEGIEVVITATGAGATAYAYAWTGAGTNGEITNTLTITSLSQPVDALCTVMGADEPGVTTYQATGITKDSATLTGNLTFNRSIRTRLERGFVYSVSPHPTLTSPGTGRAVASGTGPGLYTVTVTGLTPATTYYASAYVTDGRNTIYGNEIQFTTLKDTTVVPQTGDNSDNRVWWLLGGLSAAGLMWMALQRKKKPAEK